jgi:hypothetical protein
VVAIVDRRDIEVSHGAYDSVFGRLLGTGVDELPLPLQRFHASTVDAAGTGTFVVEQARSRVGRLVARLLRMPRCSGSTSVEFSIHRPSPRVEIWRRTFGDEVLASTQTTDGRHLFERIGPLELVFDVEADASSIRFRHVATRLRVGHLGVRVPHALSPSIAASVATSGDDLDVLVRISAPLVGTVLQYGGLLTRRAEA